MSSSEYDAAVDDSLTWWQGRAVWLVLLGLIVVAGAVFGWQTFAGRSGTAVAGGETGPASEGDDIGSESAVAASTTSPVVLRNGDNNDEVERYQRLLAAAEFDLNPDGRFGSNTERETKRFQRLIGEEPTGAVTGRTLAAAERADRMRRVRIFLLRDGQLQQSPRRVDGIQVARDTLEMLIAAPLQVERDEGLSSAVPRGTRVDRLRIADRIAAVSLSGFAADPDPESLRQRVNQIVANLTWFQSVDAVLLRLPPDELTVFTDAGVTVSGPLRGGDG